MPQANQGGDGVGGGGWFVRPQAESEVMVWIWGIETEDQV